MSNIKTMTFFDYFQIGSVSLFVLVIFAKTLYLRRRRNIDPIVIGGGKKGLLLALELVSLASVPVWLIEILFYAFHSPFHIFPWPLDIQLLTSEPARYVGVVIILAGFVLFLLAYVSFGDSWRVGFDVKSPGELVTSGVFSISRNPIYLSLDLWFFGTFLINGTLIFLIFAILAIIAQHWQILQEEIFLTSLYGQQYKDFCERTGRYVGAGKKTIQ